MPTFKETKVRDVADLHKGDQLAVSRRAYKHHMIVTEDPIDLKNVHVIQFTNDFFPGAKGIISGSGKSGADIAKVRADVEDMYSDVRNGRVYRIDYDECFSPDETVQKAESKLGEGKYCPLTNNCEHFATWCKTGVHESSQSEVIFNEAAKTVMAEGTKSVAIGAQQVASLAKTLGKEAGPDVLQQLMRTMISDQINKLIIHLATQQGMNSVMKDTISGLMHGDMLTDPVTAVNMVITFLTYISKDTVKESSKPLGQEIWKDAMSGLMHGSRDMFTDPVTVNMFKTLTFLRDISKDTVKESSKQLGQEGTKALIKEGAKSVAKSGAKQVAGEGAKTFGKEAAKTAMTEGTKSVAKDGAKAATKLSFGKKIMEKQGNIGIGLTVAEESYYFLTDTWESMGKCNKREISSSECVGQVATHAVKGVARGTASLAGGTAGQTVGSAVGLAVGAPFGPLAPAVGFVGGVVGGVLGVMVGKALVWSGGQALGFSY